MTPQCWSVFDRKTKPRVYGAVSNGCVDETDALFGGNEWIGLALGNELQKFCEKNDFIF